MAHARPPGPSALDHRGRHPDPVVLLQGLHHFGLVAVFADHLLAWLDASERFVHEGVTEPAGAGLGHQARPPLLEWQRRRLLRRRRAPPGPRQARTPGPGREVLGQVDGGTLRIGETRDREVGVADLP